MTCAPRPRPDHNDSRRVSCDGRGEGRVKVAGQMMIESPGEGDGAIAGVADVRCGAEAPEGPVGYAEACEQQDAGATGSVVDVALAGFALGGGRRLALPVDELGADGVVPVASGR